MTKEQKTAKYKVLNAKRKLWRKEARYNIQEYKLGVLCRSACKGAFGTDTDKNKRLCLLGVVNG